MHWATRRRGVAIQSLHGTQKKSYILFLALITACPASRSPSLSSFMRDLQAASLSWQICFHFFLPLALLPRRRNGHLKRTNEFALGAIIASGAAPRCVLFLLSHCGDRSIANERMSGCKITRQLCYAVTELFRSSCRADLPRSRRRCL